MPERWERKGGEKEKTAFFKNLFRKQNIYAAKEKVISLVLKGNKIYFFRKKEGERLFLIALWGNMKWKGKKNGLSVPFSKPYTLLTFFAINNIISDM